MLNLTFHYCEPYKRAQSRPTGIERSDVDSICFLNRNSTPTRMDRIDFEQVATS